MLRGNTLYKSGECVVMENRVLGTTLYDRLQIKELSFGYLHCTLQSKTELLNNLEG